MSGARTPPRFVPTLTTVLEETQPAAPQEVHEASQAPVADPALPADPSSAVALDPLAQLSEEQALRLEEQLLHRVLQRIDLSLEERVSDAVSAAVQLHLDAMIPGLRKEIEGVLRALVSEALALELSDNNLGSVPALTPKSIS